MPDLTRLVSAVDRLLRAMPRNEIALEIDAALKEAISKRPIEIKQGRVKKNTNPPPTTPRPPPPRSQLVSPRKAMFTPAHVAAEHELGGRSSVAPRRSLPISPRTGKPLRKYTRRK